MPSNKNKVTLFLDDDEKQKLEELKKEYGEQNSEVVVRLMKATDDVSLLSPEYMIEKNELEGRLERLEKHEEERAIRFACSVEKMERLEEWVCALQSEVDRLRREGVVKPIEYFTDDQVASYVGAREETVKEWRLGYRKPRGENICRKLEKFELDFGRWRRKEDVSL